MIKNKNDIGYDHDLVKRIKLDVRWDYAKLLKVILDEIRLGDHTKRIDISYHYPMSSSSKCRGVKNVLMPIEDDDDAKALMMFALENISWHI